MSNIIVVAIPSERDYVWRLSSEKVPHITLLYLDDSANATRIAEFVEHAAKHLNPFMLDVDYRDTLGELDADVLFFQKVWELPQLAQFRGQLLKNDEIKKAYDAVEQFPEWVPHLTMGYPKTPAKEDKREYPGVGYVSFDRIAVWTDNFEGPEFRLTYDQTLAEVAMSTEVINDILSHHGVKGMKWGKRRSAGSVETAPSHADAKVAKAATQKLKKDGISSLSNKELQALTRRVNLEQQVSQLNQQNSKVKKGNDKVKTILTLGATANAAIAFAKSPAGQAIKNGLVKK